MNYRDGIRIYGEDVNNIKHMLPRFFEELKDGSLGYSAKIAGFDWDYWRKPLLELPEVQEHYNRYIEGRKRGGRRP